MSQPKISVIVPIYNVEEYLTLAMDSLLEQTYQNLEIIAMDDGSTDSSFLILQRYAAKDSRIQIYHWENAGYSETLRRGISFATGEYLAFLDSDDWAEPQFIEVLYQTLAQNNADFSICSYAVFDNRSGKSFINDKSWIQRMLEKNNGKMLPGAEQILFDDAVLWNKLFKLNFFNSLPVQIHSEMKTAPDVPVVWSALLSAKRIAVTPQILVHYRTGRKGQHTAAKDNRFFACFDIFKYLFQFTDSIPQYKVLEPYFLHLQISRYLWGYERIPASSHKAYFDQVCDVFQRRGYTKDSPIAYSSANDKQLPEKFRALILRVLHPMSLKAVVEKRMALWNFIFFVRKELNNAFNLLHYSRS